MTTLFHHHHDFSIGNYQFRASVFAPQTSLCNTDSPVFSLRFQDGLSFRSLLMQSGSDNSFSMMITVVDDVKNKAGQLISFFDRASGSETLNPCQITSELTAMAKTEDLLIAASAVTINQELQEDSLTFAMLDILMAGLPPAVVIEEGQFSFPVRSGIPFGINDLLLSEQPLELPVEASLFLHTPLHGSSYSLKDMHIMLSSFNKDEIPEGVMVFQLELLQA